MAGFGNIRKGRREAVENLGYTEGGDCPRCGGDAENSTMQGYLRCAKCSHEWADPDYVEEKKSVEVPTYHRDAELIEQFKKEVELVVWLMSLVSKRISHNNKKHLLLV